MESSLFAPKWSPAIKDQLGQLVDAGLTSEQIARKLSNDWGFSFSRNAIISQIGRLGLQLKGKSRRQIGDERKRETVAPLVATAPATTTRKRSDVDPVPEPSPAGDVSFGCRWLHSKDPRERNFCGAERFRLKPYCEHHFARVYRVPTPEELGRRKRQAAKLETL